MFSVELRCGLFFFFKQTPAYEMRISDWSSDCALPICGREVLLGDFRTIDLGQRKVEALVGNPPFEMDVIEGFLDRAHQILPDDGLVAMVLPAYAFQRPSRVSKWMDRFAIDGNMIPRTLFPGLSKPLVWAK